MSHNEPRWSLITVTHNSVPALERWWSKVRFVEEAEWVVVDNASSDRSREIAGELGARVIPLAVNRGFGAANNVGFHQSSGRYVIFVNPDVMPQMDDLDLLRSRLDAEPNSLVAPQLLNADGTLQPNGRGLPYLSHKVMNRLQPQRVADLYHRYAAPGEVAPCVWLIGAVVAGRREWLSKLGPWNEKFFLYYEDHDLGLRNGRAGGRSLVMGSAQWMHGWERATITLNWKAWRRELASMTKFYLRYPGLLVPPISARREGKR
jgi:GT2 family glycosyltransferase